MVNDLNIDVASRLSVASAFGLVGSSILAIVEPRLLAMTVLCAVGLLALNTHVYVFLSRKRGLWFALRAIPWHWLYYLYSGAAFAVATLEHPFSRPHAGAASMTTDAGLSSVEAR